MYNLTVIENLHKNIISKMYTTCYLRAFALTQLDLSKQIITNYWKEINQMNFENDTSQYTVYFSYWGETRIGSNLGNQLVLDINFETFMKNVFFFQTSRVFV